MKKKILIGIIAVVCLILTGFTAKKYIKQTKNETKITETKIAKKDQKIKAGDIVVKAKVEADEIIKAGDTETIYEDSNLVVVGKVLKKEDGKFDQEAGEPITLGKFQVYKTIKGIPENDIIDFVMGGGICTVEDFVKYEINSIRAEKFGFNKMSKDEQRKKYIEIRYPRQKDFEEGKEYVLMLKTYDDDPTKTHYAMSYAGFLDLNVEDEKELKSLKSEKKLTENDINSLEDILNMPNACFEK